MFLPMSCKSPQPSPRPPFPFDAYPQDAQDEEQFMFIASFMISPVIISSDRKDSPASYFSPTFLIPFSRRIHYVKWRKPFLKSFLRICHNFPRIQVKKRTLNFQHFLGHLPPTSEEYRLLQFMPFTRINKFMRIEILSQKI